MNIIKQFCYDEIENIDQLYLLSCLGIFGTVFAILILILPILRDQKIYSQKIVMLLGRLNQKEVDKEVNKLRTFENMLKQQTWFVNDYLYVMIEKQEKGGVEENGNAT
jgi:hypothetical protein